MWVAIACAVAASYASYAQTRGDADDPQRQCRDPLADMARSERLASEARRVQRSALYGTALPLALVASGIWAAIDIFGWM
jgi:hypothetical protein